MCIVLRMDDLVPVGPCPALRQRNVCQALSWPAIYFWCLHGLCGKRTDREAALCAQIVVVLYIRNGGPEFILAGIDGLFVCPAVRSFFFVFETDRSVFRFSGRFDRICVYRIGNGWLFSPGVVCFADRERYRLPGQSGIIGCSCHISVHIIRSGLVRHMTKVSAVFIKVFILDPVGSVFCLGLGFIGFLAVRPVFDAQRPGPFVRIGAQMDGHFARDRPGGRIIAFDIRIIDVRIIGWHEDLMGIVLRMDDLVPVGPCPAGRERNIFEHAS